MRYKAAHIKKFFLIIAAFFCICAYAADLDSCDQKASGEWAYIKKVVDGDTLRLMDGRKVRLLGVNAPELRKSGQVGKVFARQSQYHLRKMLPVGSKVWMQLGIREVDRYSRTLAHVFSPQGEHVNAALLEKGLVYLYLHPPNLAYAACYKNKQKASMGDRAGVWGNSQTYLHEQALADKAQGDFVVVDVKIQTLRKTKKSLWIMGDHLRVRIAHADWVHFDLQELYALKYKKIRILGYLSWYKGKPTVRVRHPYMLLPIT